MLKRNMPLNTQVVMMVAVMLLFPLLAVGLGQYWGITNDLESLERETLRHNTVSSKELLAQMGANQLDLVKSYSYWEEFRKSLEAKDTQWMEENVLTVPDVLSTVHFAVIAGLDGKVAMETQGPEGFTESIDPLLVQKFNSSSNFHTLVSIGDKLAIIAIAPINDEDGAKPPAGMLIFGRYMDETVLATIQQTLHADIAFAAASGEYLGVGETSSENKLRPHMERMLAGDGYESFEKARVGKQQYGQMVTSLNGLDGKKLGLFYISLPLEKSVEIHDKLILMYTVVGLLLLLVLIVFSLWLRQRIVKPLQHVASILERTAEGTLTEKLDPRYERRRDEIGLLAQSFERMRASFRSIAAGVHSLSEELTGSSGQLAATTEQSMQAGEQLKATVREMASGAQAQLLSTEESARSMQEMAAGIGRIAEGAGAVADMSIRTTALAREGNESVMVAMNGMDSIAGSVRESAGIIRRLHEHTQNIGEIVDMVSAVAQQTNLLALNAAIEAARAGEAGRGFAVVASEVRKLAEQSARSIEQITELLGSIRTGADRSVSAMNQVSADVEQGSDAMAEVTRLFSDIQAAMDKVAVQVEEVSAVSEQLSAGSEQISATVEEMAGISAGASARTNEVSRFTEDQSDVMEGISKAMSELNINAKQLHKLVEHMKV